MIYLILQIVFASAFTLIIKWIHLRKKEDVITVGSINYIVGAIAALPFAWQVTTDVATPGAIWTGASMGQVYFIAFFFVIYCVKHVGASVTTVVSVLSLLFPITLAAVIWKEFPSQLQAIGIAMAVIALLLISVRGGYARTTGVAKHGGNAATGETQVTFWMATSMLLIFFGLCGCSRLAQETFKHVSQPEQRAVFLLSAFGVTAAYSLATLLYRRRKICSTELGLGLLMGLANVLQTQLILKSLELFPGYIVFTVTSAGAIVLTTLVATLLMREQIEKRAMIGIGLAVASLFILNLNRD